MVHTKKQDRAITRTAGAARLSPCKFARGWAKRNMMRLLMEPKMMNVTRATWNTRLT